MITIQNGSLVKNPATDLEQSFIGQEVSFDIAELYNPNSYNNQITCHIHFGDKDYYKDTNFYFGKQGSNGTNGTDVIAKISYAGPDYDNILHYQPLTLYTQKINQTVQGMLNVGPKKLSETIQLASNGNSQNNEGDNLKVELFQKEELIGESNYAAGYPRWTVAGNASETSNTSSKLFEMANSKLSWNPTFKNDDNSRFRGQNFRASIQLKPNQDKGEEIGAMYYAYFSLPMIEYTEDVRPATNLMSKENRIIINNDSCLNEVVYNAAGRNHIYNHNHGLKLSNLPKDCTIY